MLWFNSKSALKTGVPQKADGLLISMVKDLEDTREIYHGYSYVRTMRNILIGKDDAAIASFFRDKPYYGQFEELKLEALEHMMDAMTVSGQLCIIYTEHGKLYCTQEYHDKLCKNK